VAAVMDALDVFVLPSHLEGLGTIVLDALAAGKPVVATRTGGVPEMIEDGRHGLLVPPRDGAALGAAVLRVLEDPALGVRLAEAGCRRVEEEFSADAMARGNLRVYLELGPAGEGPADPPLVPRRRGARDGGRGGARRSPAGREIHVLTKPAFADVFRGNPRVASLLPGTRRRGWGTREAACGARGTRWSPISTRISGPGSCVPSRRACAGASTARAPSRGGRRCSATGRRGPRPTWSTVTSGRSLLSGSRRAAASRGSTRARSSARAPSVCCAAQAGRARG